MLRTILAVFIALLTVVVSCNNDPATKSEKSGAEVTGAQNEYQFDLDSLLAKYARTEFTLSKDLVYGNSRKYLGLKSDTVFEDLIKKYNLDTSKYMVVFYCSDGYKPRMNLSDLTDSGGYFAMRDISTNSPVAKPGKVFSPIYLVWKIDSFDNVHQFPYGVSKIGLELKANQNALEELLKDQPKLVEGYHKFRDNCQKCHAINGDGGTVGPELNYPMNVTEYWNASQLPVFIKNPPKFRNNSKMPVVENISDSDISHIIYYLAFMKQHKK